MLRKNPVVFSEMLDEFEWPALEVCSVGIGLLSFSSIGFIVVLCLLKIKRQVLEPAHSSKALFSPYYSHFEILFLK